MGFVFISYSRKDSQKVSNLTSRLEKDGIQVWIDCKDIKPGRLWTVEIVKAIDTAEAFLLMLSPNSAKSDNVRKEVQLAQDAKRSLFPLMLAVIKKLPPEFRYQLAGIQMINYAKDPRTRYHELVEVLKANRERLANLKPRKIRQAELYFGRKRLSGFKEKKQEKVRSTIATIGGIPQSEVRTVRLRAGSVRMIIELPTDSAYALKTAALNRDKRLLEEGIDAVRLDGETNFILVKSGEIGPLSLLKRPFPFLGTFVLILIALATVTGGLLFAFNGNIPLFPPPKLAITQASFPPATNPSLPLQKPTDTATPRSDITSTPTTTPIYGITSMQTATFTSTPASTYTSTPTWPPTPTSTPTYTSTPTRPPTSTPTSTPTPTAIPNDPPPAPVPGYPIDKTPVGCYGNIILSWKASYDPDGIKFYNVELSQNFGGTWKIIYTVPELDGTQTQLDVTKPVYGNCGQWFMWRVQAVDGTGQPGNFSPDAVFGTDVK